MFTILIVDDDEAVRNKAMRALARSDIQLASAANGRLALEQAAILKPHIVICDVDMPEINGFDVLAALKADETLVSAQVMMLTSQNSRNSVRLGMSLGADDYLTKPFSEEEIVQAVDGLIRRRGRLQVQKEVAAKQHEDSLRARFAERIAGGQEALASEATGAPTEQLLADAAVLFADIRGFTSIAEKLSSHDVATLLTEYFDRTCEPVVAHGGQFLKLLGDGLMTVFVPDEAQPGSPAQRAVAAANEMVALTRDLASWVNRTFPDAMLPPFRVGFGIHCGEVAITRLGTAGRKTDTPIGDTVNIASRLEDASKDLGWDIVASRTLVERLGEGVRVGATSTITVRGRETPIEVCELLPAPAGREAEQTSVLFSKTLVLPRTRTQRLPVDAEMAGKLRADAREHAGLAARAINDALSEKLSALRASEPLVKLDDVRLQGFRILRRLASGGMSTVYLSRREVDGELVVLKILKLDPSATDQRARFVREFSLLSAIQHPHVVRLFNQGFCDDAAYIAMEYFENGDLRARMSGPLPPRQALTVVQQVADALGAIHKLGIVHRDLKPENLMVRSDGNVVLADFGIAKAMAGPLADHTTLTVVGELIGSPSYMSPEQIMGAHLTGRSDLYSLGVLLYELLTGQRPYKGATLMELLSLHARAELPRLPDPLAALQPVLAGLMAKRPDQRFHDADHALQMLRAAATKFDGSAAQGAAQ